MTESHKTQERMPVFQRIVNRPVLIERISGIHSESVSQVLIKEGTFPVGQSASAATAIAEVTTKRIEAPIPL